jgi:hypothetical protein
MEVHVLVAQRSRQARFDEGYKDRERERGDEDARISHTSKTVGTPTARRQGRREGRAESHRVPDKEHGLGNQHL